MEKITSRENAKVKYACRLASSGAFRRAEGRFLAEGRKLCPELCRGAELETLFCTESALEKCPELSELPGEHYLVEDHVADKLADVGTHQGVFGVFRTPVHTLEEVKTGGRYLALERVQDPGNVGTLLRSAAAFGFDGVLLSDGLHALIAEDNELNLEIAKLMLEETGICVECAADGKEAVAKFEESEPGYYDVIFMDIMMPYMNGWDATRKIRTLQRPDADKIPIIAMSANAFAEDIINSHISGMNWHLTKPIVADKLMTALKECIRKNNIR